MNKINIIAEIGINSNGDVEKAKHLATVAKYLGCDFVKLQKRNPDWCYSPDKLASLCDSPWGTTVGDKVRGRELSWDAIHEFDRHCKSIGIEWFCSCFDLDSLRKLHEYFPHRPWNKVPSSMALRIDFLKEIAAQKIRTLISWALCPSWDSVYEIAEIFESSSCSYVINHCQALYPCPIDRLNLSCISRLKEIFTDSAERAWPCCVGIGYSGHEVGVMPSVVASMLGATWVERHITLDRSMYGADQAASLEPRGLEILVRDLRVLEQIMGDGEQKLRGDEKNPVTYWRIE